MKENDIPVFPALKYSSNKGMTLRDYFAGQALLGFLSNETLRKNNQSGTAFSVYDIADEMLAEWSKIK